jgi:glycosyltransferase involved in cell wall biosynthesis
MDKWLLEKIPKICSFYWGNDKLPWLRMMSVVSFHKLNPEWKVIFYYPVERYTGNATWNTGEQSLKFTGEDYYNYFNNNYPGIEKRAFDFKTLNISNQMPEVFKSDFLRWHLLSTEGGLWSDMDILYFKPMSDFNKNKNEYKTRDTFICLNNGYHSIGFLMASRNNNFYSRINQMAKGSFFIRDYQSAGSRLFTKYGLNNIQNIQALNIENIDMDIVYAIDSRNIPKIFEMNNNHLLKESSIGIHWYAGDKLANDLVNRMNEKNYSEFSNTISNILLQNRFIIDNAQALSKKNNRFKIITTCYNAQEYIERCIVSVLNQTYQNYEMIIIDDCSTDLTKEIISSRLMKDKQAEIKAVFNIRQKTKVLNIIDAVALCEKEDIIIILDADDYLSGPDVLEYLNNVYNDPDIWLTYGQFEPVSKKYSNYCKPIENFRLYRKSNKWVTSHLRSFKKWLCDKIKIDDLKDPNGNFSNDCEDLKFMFPMLEMAGYKHTKFIQKVLYIYNDLNPISALNNPSHAQELAQLEAYFRAKDEYDEIDKPKVSLLITTYNRTELLKWTLLSLSGQGLKNKFDIETIILDDGKEDLSILDLINSYKYDLNTKYINTGKTKANQNDWRIPGYAFNIGVKQCKGDYIILMCAEIYSLENRTIENMINPLLETGKMLTIPEMAKDDDGTFIDALNKNMTLFDYKGMRNLNVLLPFFMGMRKIEYIEIGGYDEDLIGMSYDDNDLVDRLIANGNQYKKVNSKVIHLYHERKWDGPFDSLPQERKDKISYNKKIYKSRKGIIKRNQLKGWGNFMNETDKKTSPRWVNPIEITMAITSCKRYMLLEKTLISFFNCCLDSDLISRIVLIDDNSSSDQLRLTKELLERFNKPFIILHKSKDAGHVSSLNYYHDLIKTDFIVQMEDDWEFFEKDNLISKALFVMNENPEVKQVVYRMGDNTALGQTEVLTSNGIKYIKYNYHANSNDKLGRGAWPGYNLNPSLQKWSDIKTLGKFNQEVNGFEFDFSRRYLKAGFKLSYFPNDACRHLGEGQSSYVLNNTKK